MLDSIVTTIGFKKGETLKQRNVVNGWDEMKVIIQLRFLEMLKKFNLND